MRFDAGGVSTTTSGLFPTGHSLTPHACRDIATGVWSFSIISILFQLRVRTVEGPMSPEAAVRNRRAVNRRAYRRGTHEPSRSRT